MVCRVRTQQMWIGGDQSCPWLPLTLDIVHIVRQSWVAIGGLSLWSPELLLAVRYSVQCCPWTMKGLSAGVFWLLFISFALLVLRVFSSRTLHSEGKEVRSMTPGICNSKVMVHVQCQLCVSLTAQALKARLAFSRSTGLRF